MLAACAALLCACSGADGGALDAAPVDAAAEADVAVAPPDSTPPDVTAPPRRCAAGEACNALLDGDGKCPGQCIVQRYGMTCRGQVQHGLCYALPRPRTNAPQTIYNVRVEPTTVPVEVMQGQVATFVVTVTNLLASAHTVSFGYTLGSSWQLVEASFAGQTQLVFASKESKQLTVKLRAVAANVFGSDGNVLTLLIANRAFPLVNVVGFGPQGNVACGQRYFPASYSKLSGRYRRGVCCEGKVFYPASECCGNGDCPRGSCIDGLCLSADDYKVANTLPIGHHRVLLVLSDQADQPHDPAAICTNRYAELRAKLALDRVERSLHDIIKQHTARETLALRWTVLAGINKADYNPGGSTQLNPMHDALEAFLIKRGCISGPGQFDKTIILSPTLDLAGYSGLVAVGGRVGVKRVDDGLLVHELLHTFGATDLYRELGGQLQYARDWMTSGSSKNGTPRTGVAWGEIRLGDLDRNGVIDLFEHATKPDKLVLRSAKATVTGKGTLELELEIDIEENGAVRRTLLRDVLVSLPDSNASKTVRRGQSIVFDGKTEVDLAAIQAKGSVRVRVEATARYTDETFARKTVTLVAEKTVTLGGN